METLIEKDSAATPLIILGVIFLLFLAGGLGLAYLGGVFTGKDAVAENDKRIMLQALSKPSPTTTPKPVNP